MQIYTDHRDYKVTVASSMREFRNSLNALLWDSAAGLRDGLKTGSPRQENRPWFRAVKRRHFFHKTKPWHLKQQDSHFPKRFWMVLVAIWRWHPILNSHVLVYPVIQWWSMMIQFSGKPAAAVPLQAVVEVPSHDSVEDCQERCRWGCSENRWVFFGFFLSSYGFLPTMDSNRAVDEVFSELVSLSVL